MKISLIKPSSTNIDPWINEFERQGVEVLDGIATPDCDFIIGASHSQTSRIKAVHEMYPDIPMINYNWDMYEWIWKEPRGYDWPGYGELLNKSVEVWCPSEEVILRAEEFFGCGDKHKVIKTFARFFDVDINKVKDSRYIYNPIRDLPSDRNFGWLDRVAKKHNLPVYKSEHRLTEQEFQQKIIECSFMVCELYEASTGGLTLLEGYHYGKPCVVCDSRYMGAKDYFGDKAYYYKHDSFEDFERVILEMWNNTPKLDIQKCRELTNKYTLDKMVREMVERLEVLNG